MARAITVGSPSGHVLFPFATIRSVGAPDEQNSGRRRYCGIAPANSLFALGTDENVRGYLGRDDDGTRRKSTQVNMRIRETIEDDRDRFHLLNTGVVMVAREAEVDDQKKLAKLSACSIINGAQTRGVLEEWFSEHPDDTDFPWVNFELIVTDDEDLIGDVSIARNYQNKVEDLSIYGRRRLLDSLEAAMQKLDPETKLRKAETDFGDAYLDSEKLIQVLTAMAPTDLPLPSAEKRKDKTPETIYRVYAYRHRSRCLRDFAHVMDDSAWGPNEDWSLAKTFFLGMAGDAWKKYNDLRGEQAFSPLKCVRGEEIGGRKRVLSDGVPDGIVFPMLSALSRFAKRGRDNYRLVIPREFPWDIFFQQAMVVHKNVAFHNPQTMGKDAGCYVALHGLMSMFGATAGKV